MCLRQPEIRRRRSNRTRASSVLLLPRLRTFDMTSDRLRLETMSAIERSEGRRQRNLKIGERGKLGFRALAPQFRELLFVRWSLAVKVADYRVF